MGVSSPTRVIQHKRVGAVNSVVSTDFEESKSIKRSGDDQAIGCAPKRRKMTLREAAVPQHLPTFYCPL